VIDFEHQQRQPKLNRIAYVRNIKLQSKKESALSEEETPFHLIRSLSNNQNAIQ